MSPPKTCAVCGDKALGYNFNAVTCESCKAFFRRNALAKKQFTCPFKQNCDITVVTRRFCQKCRLKKCINIGMNSENIMSEEDKLVKRRKIENNRAKRNLYSKKEIHKDKEIKDEKVDVDSSGFEASIESFDSQSCGSLDSSSNVLIQSENPSSSKIFASEAYRDINTELMTSEEMVEFIVGDPDRASQAISRMMRTPVEAVATLEKIINSQKDALRLISHLIAFPGDGLKIISKIMNSPFNALTVFTKFMSSPTDALEIISKIVSSPQDVLQFIKNLMNSPEDALDIMNKFMNTPAEALKIINKLFNGPQTQTRVESNVEILSKDDKSKTNVKIQDQLNKSENTLLYSMLKSSSNEQNQVLLASQKTPEETTLIFSQSPQITLTSSSANPITSSDFHLEKHFKTSAEILESTPDNITSEFEYSNEQFSMKSIMQNSFTDNMFNGEIDSLNSLETVLSEVIRIEFQAFNNLPQEPRIKQELYGVEIMPPQQEQYHKDFMNRNSQRQLQPSPSMYSPTTSIVGRDLNETEQLKLRELKAASEALYYPLDEDMNTLMMGDERIKADDTHQDPKLLQVINLTAVAIKRLIKMAKKIGAFRDMCQEDQVALLKGGCTEMMIMRSVMTYDVNRNMWKIPHTKEDMSNLRSDVLKLAKGNVYEEHLKFIRTFDEKWRLDENIILIMCAIVLFMPTRHHIIHSDVIRLEQNSYYYLLRRYLESVYHGCEAKLAFIKLIEKISDVERLNRSIIGVYLNVNPSQVEPLLREIFDLKNH